MCVCAWQARRHQKEGRRIKGSHETEKSNLYHDCASVMAGEPRRAYMAVQLCLDPCVWTASAEDEGPSRNYRMCACVLVVINAVELLTLRVSVCVCVCVCVCTLHVYIKKP